MKSRRLFGSTGRPNPEFAAAAAAVVMLLVAALQVWMPSSAELPHVDIARPKPLAELSTPEANYPAILDHPLFAPDRAPVVLAAQPSTNLMGYEVLGTAIAGKVSTALVRLPMGSIIRIKPDGTLQGWRLISIERTQLVFDRDGEKRTLPVNSGPARQVGSLQAGMTAGRMGPNAGSDDSENKDNNSDDSDDDDDE